MVRCSKVVIVQLLAFVTVLGLLNFYFNNAETETSDTSTQPFNEKLPTRIKFNPSDESEAQEEEQEESGSPETAYNKTLDPDSQETEQEQNDAQEKLRIEQKEAEERLRKEQEEAREKLRREQEQEEAREKLKREQEQREAEEKLRKEQEEALEKLRKEQVQKEAVKNSKSAEEVINERMQRVKEVCKRLNYPNSNQYNMYLFRKYGKSGISWCPTFKASSSTWRDFFIDNVLGSHANFMGTHYHLGVLGNQILTRGAGRGASAARKRVFSGEAEDSVRFTVVRHPISRLISHLRKAQNYPDEVRAQRGDWVEESVINGRTNPLWDTATRTKYKREWDVYINEIGSGRHSPFSDDNPYLHPPYPVFPELIDFVMRHKGRDDKGNNGHWRPTIEWCDLCQNDLDIIIQLEQEPEELMVLLDRLQMMQYKGNFLSKHNSSSNRSASADEIKEYVKQLNKEQKEYLNKLYAPDFEMLGYDPIDMTA